MPDKDEFERAKAGQIDHIGVKLWSASHVFVDRMMKELAGSGYHDLTLAHSALLPHLDIDGSRNTLLASRSGLSKQAIGQMVDELERRGYVTREADPEDGRAKLVRYTAKGLRFITDSQTIERNLEAECRRALSHTAFADLEASLAKLVQVLSAENPVR